MVEMSNWSIEQELLTLSHTESIVEAVVSLGLLPVGETLNSVRSEQDWVRSGAETFQFTFWIETKSGRMYKYLLKACTVFGAFRGLDAIVDEWLARRNLLNKTGIATPKLYASANGLVLEEFIPYSLADIQITDTILVDLAYLAGTLSRLGFSPVDGVFGDLRSHKDDVVVVDFGEDLGPPNASSRKDDHLFNLILSQLKRWKFDISTDTLDNMRARFQSTQNSIL